MDKNSKILITGSKGLIGSSLYEMLITQGYNNIVAPSSKELNLLDQLAVKKFFEEHKPEYVFHLAAIVGGIIANSTLGGKFLYDNTQMQLNVIHYAYLNGVKKLLFPGSACTYPKFAEQPVKEESFMTGSVEPTNIAYATAKINGIIMCQQYRSQYGTNFIVPMPTNAYGVNDSFDPTNSHVIPALIQRIHKAKTENSSEIIVWGTGKPLREFIFADDVADAFIFLMQNYNDASIINVGTMAEISILELTKTIAKVVGFKGEIVQDLSKPDGTPRKLLDSNKLFNLGWKPKVTLEEGITKVYKAYLAKNLVSQ
ncbi:MAG: GDP-L-fucose synthase [Sphingobacteriia bacterium]|nr:GDP-L-fucose synthase [Sphingobacteriia bacterium]